MSPSRPNGWTEWADIFCGHSGIPGGCFRLNKFEFFFPKFFFSKFFFLWATRNDAL